MHAISIISDITESCRSISYTIKFMYTFIIYLF